MSNTDEIRWKQRFQNYGKALSQLAKACDQDSYSDLERAGLVQMFEFTFELSWKTLKDLLFYEGYDAKSPRDVIRKAFEAEYVSEDDTETFLAALDNRNVLSHPYNDEAAHEAERLITEEYYFLLQRVYDTLLPKSKV
jgi:nucleotidyltransferase substrate binding protein (TIGR01987 family)